MELTFGIVPINSKNNLYGDGIARLEQYDFSRANMNDETRTHAISAVATICTQKFDSIGSEKLCMKLLTEAHGIPSSAYGFVPVLLTEDQSKNVCDRNGKKFSEELNIFKFGQILRCRKKDSDISSDETVRYLLTNLRALVNDIGIEASKDFYNTDEYEINIIKENFKVFKHKIDLRSARQIMRHTTAVWQELSRRYVSGKKVPFEFYISDKMKAVESTVSGQGDLIGASTEDLVYFCVEHYYQALEQGVKPQDARDILPVCMYTEVWSGWQPFALENMLIERTAIGTQWESRQVAEAMKELIKLDEGK